MQKICKKCGVEQPISNFEKRIDAHDAYRHQCKSCRRAYIREWNKTDKGRKRAQRSAGPRKTKAHNIVYRAIANGTLVRSDRCSNCGAIGETEAHHHDYGQPLSVVWLCTPCHTKLHVIDKQAREGRLLAVFDLKDLVKNLGNEQVSEAKSLRDLADGTPSSRAVGG